MQWLVRIRVGQLDKLRTDCQSVLSGLSSLLNLWLQLRSRVGQVNYLRADWQSALYGLPRHWHATKAARACRKTGLRQSIIKSAQTPGFRLLPRPAHAG